MNITRYTPFALLLAASVMISACGGQADPYTREGMWHPSGVVNANLAAQLVNPHDLVQGHGDNSPNYKTATTSLDHLWNSGQASATAGAPAGAATPAAAPPSGAATTTGVSP